MTYGTIFFIICLEEVDNRCGKLFYQTKRQQTMNDTDKTQKIRFKLANGEEFEAEGSLEFIESQRSYFLELIKKKPPHNTPAPRPLPPPREDSSVSGTLTPRLYATAPGTYADGPSRNPVAPIPYTETALPPNRLWEQLLKQEGDTLFLRRKLRLNASEAALLILGGAKTLLNTEECRALWLSKAIALSGFQIPRLDRQLAPAMKLGYILCIGSKRSRAYTLTPAGFAHAFMLAQKKAGLP